MSLEVKINRYLHPDGKQYLNAIVQDDSAMGMAIHVTNWGKRVLSEDFSIGQVGWQAGSVASVNTWFGKEHEKRLSRGYQCTDTRPLRPLNSREVANLASKGVSFAVFSSQAEDGHGGVTAEGDLVEDPTTYVGVSMLGSTATGGRRMEWVLENPDHEQAFEQMMHAAGQLQKVVEDAQSRAAKAQTDLQFAKAWMAQRMRKEAG